MILWEELNVCIEEEVFEVILVWVRREEDECKDFFLELFKNVRLFLISLQYLCDKVFSDELIKSNLVCCDLVDEVKDYFFMFERRCKFQLICMKLRCCSEVVCLIYVIGGLIFFGEVFSIVEMYDILIG